MNSENIVMWVTQLSIVDWVFFKTQTLLATLRIQNQPQEVCCVSSEAAHLFPSAGCARNKHQSHSSTEAEIVSLDAKCSVQQTTLQDKVDQPKEICAGQETIPTIKNKTKTPTEKRKREVEQLSNVAYAHQHTFFSKRV